MCISVSMPCLRCASIDSTLTTSTSNRCSLPVPAQRVPQSTLTHKQLRRTLATSRTVVQRAVLHCNARQPVVTQPVGNLTPQHIAQESPAQIFYSQQFGRCMAQGFAAAAFLSFLAPLPSYSAESLPIGLLKSWVVSCHSTSAAADVHTRGVAACSSPLQEQVESLGPVVGPLIFVLTMASAEMIPLFPTQPLSLASGLLFGPVQVCIALTELFICTELVRAAFKNRAHCTIGKI